MRRNDRAITLRDEILAVIAGCDVCRLALCDGGTPYIVPLNFGYSDDGGRLTLYFHGAKEGRKLDLIRKNPAACFEMDRAHRLITGENACNFTMEYESVIGSGTIAICDGAEEKRRAMERIMAQYAPNRTFSFDDRTLEMVMVFRLEVAEFTGKRHGTQR